MGAVGWLNIEDLGRLTLTVGKYRQRFCYLFLVSLFIYLTVLLVVQFNQNFVTFKAHSSSRESLSRMRC